uniref:TFIIS N-terminal domain-containing protein n=1 Tax=Parascaris univalens TaxID=6257 RepID=A0A915A932_PARUN
MIVGTTPSSSHFEYHFHRYMHICFSNLMSCTECTFCLFNCSSIASRRDVTGLSTYRLAIIRSGGGQTTSYAVSAKEKLTESANESGMNVFGKLGEL